MSSVVFFLSKQRSLNFHRRPQCVNSSRRYHTRSVGAEKRFRIGAHAHGDDEANSLTTRKTDQSEQDTCLLNKRMSKVSGESVSMDSVKSRIRSKMQRFSIFSHHSANNKSFGLTKSVEFTERSCPPALSTSSSSLSSASISDTDLDIYLDETLNRSTTNSLKKKIIVSINFPLISKKSLSVVVAIDEPNQFITLQIFFTY
uniref:Uncharacterized protein n=1 Tax=Romanomermis culicivorax TaxID=13658 RepID=A0A915HIQ8_ROMCU